MSGLRSASGGVTSVPVMGLYFMKSPRKTAKDYVQDGLVAMWDGEWNAGGGVHDPNATTWMDLSGNGHVGVLGGAQTWGSNYGMNCGFSVGEKLFDSALSFTIEVVWETSSQTNGYSAPIADRKGYCYGTSGIGRWDSNNLVYSAIGGRGLIWDSSGYGIRQHSLAYADGIGYFKKNGKVLVSGEVSNAQIETFRNVTPWYVACNRFDDVHLDNKYFSLRCYSRALSADEIAANYAIDKERFNLP